MKRVPPAEADELRPEYKRSDFGEMVRGKYSARIAAGSNVVLLDPEVATIFPTDRAVNDALRSLIDIAKAATRTPRRPKSAGPRTAVPHQGPA